MNRQCSRLSNVTKDYLSTYHCILDEMIREMTEAGLGDSISYNFIVQMIPHHQAAIEMSQNILKYTTFVPVQDIALQIIQEQTKSIENMRQILCCCQEASSSQQDLYLYQCRMNQIMQTMFSRMGSAHATNQINADFMREMIPHHQGAVEMSETTLQYSLCPGLYPILDAIIVSQKRGIVMMQKLLKCVQE